MCFPQLYKPNFSFCFAFVILDVNTVGSVHSSEHDIRFEDFFWNGSGDEPLTLSLRSNARLMAANGFVGRETFIKTATVIATVYIDDSVSKKKKQKKIYSHFGKNQQRRLKIELTICGFECFFFFFRVKIPTIQIVIRQIAMMMTSPIFIYHQISDFGSSQRFSVNCLMMIFPCYRIASLIFIASLLRSTNI